MSDVVYLYGFVPADTPPPPAALIGVSGAGIALLDVGPVYAAVSHISDEAFLPGHVEQRLNDLAWVGEQGIAHERVVAWFVDHAEILPARLFTLHSSEPALRQSVSARAGQLAAQLRAFAGRREWNLKVAYDAGRLAAHGADVSDALRTLEEQVSAAPPGKRYLLERKRSELARTEVRRAAKRLADELLQTLSAHALETRVLPLNPDAANGNVVLSAALLVSREAEPALQAAAATQLERLEALGMLVAFSGPWAPYRFLESDVGL